MKAKLTSTKKSAPRKKSGSSSARTAERAEEREENKQTKVMEAVLTEMTAAPEAEHIEEDVEVECPYCGETFEIHVTSEMDGQSMYEDCQVCSRPASVHIEIEDGEVRVEAGRA